MSVTITYTLSEAEFMRATRALWSYRAIGDTGNLVIAVSAAAIGPILLLNGISTGWLFVGAAVLFVALTMLRNVLWRRAYRKMVKYTGPITATLEADAVSTRSTEGESTLPWSAFKSYAETPSYIFLLIRSRGLSIIPKEAFPSDDDLEQARISIAANLPRRKMRWT